MKKTRIIKVSYPCYSESKNSTCHYTKHSNNYKSWSNLMWFPKKNYKVKVITGMWCLIEVPEWLYNKISK